MPGRTRRRNTAPKRTTATKPTGRMVKRRTAAGPQKATKPRPTTKPRKTTKLRPEARSREISRDTRPQRRVTSTTKKSVIFTLDAAAEWGVSIAGSFNNWEPQSMTKGQDGLWRIMLQLAPGTYQYKFMVDLQWREDPRNPRKIQNESGGYNSICEVL